MPQHSKLTPEQEQEFQTGTPWFQQFVSEHGEEPDLDTPQYDYRTAWVSGARPEINPTDEKFHWPSKTEDGQPLKSDDHPTAWKQSFVELTGKDPDEVGVDEAKGKKYVEQHEGKVGVKQAVWELLGGSRETDTLAYDPDFLDQYNQRVEDLAAQNRPLSWDEKKELLHMRNRANLMARRFEGENESTEVFAEDSVVDNFVEGFAQQKHNILANAFDYYGTPEAKEEARRRRIMANERQYDGADTKAGFMGNLAAQSIPSLAILLGGPVGAGLGTAHFAIQGAGTGRREYNDTKERVGGEKTFLGELAMSTGYAAAETLSELLGLKILTNMGSKAVFKLGKETLRSAIKSGSNEALKNVIGSYGKIAGATALEEFGEEGFTALVQDAIETSINPETGMFDEGLLEYAARTGMNALESGAAGAAGAGFIAPAVLRKARQGGLKFRDEVDSSPDAKLRALAEKEDLPAGHKKYVKETLQARQNGEKQQLPTPALDPKKRAEMQKAAVDLSEQELAILAIHPDLHPEQREIVAKELLGRRQGNQYGPARATNQRTSLGEFQSAKEKFGEDEETLKRLADEKGLSEPEPVVGVRTEAGVAQIRPADDPSLFAEVDEEGARMGRADATATREDVQRQDQLQQKFSQWIDKTNLSPGAKSYIKSRFQTADVYGRLATEEEVVAQGQEAGGEERIAAFTDTNNGAFERLTLLGNAQEGDLQNEIFHIVGDSAPMDVQQQLVDAYNQEFGTELESYADAREQMANTYQAYTTEPKATDRSVVQKIRTMISPATTEVDAAEIGPFTDAMRRIKDGQIAELNPALNISEEDLQARRDAEAEAREDVAEPTEAETAAQTEADTRREERTRGALDGFAVRQVATLEQAYDEGEIDDAEYGRSMRNIIAESQRRAESAGPFVVNDAGVAATAEQVQRDARQDQARKETIAQQREAEGQTRAASRVADAPQEGPVRYVDPQGRVMDEDQLVDRLWDQVQNPLRRQNQERDSVGPFIANPDGSIMTREQAIAQRKDEVEGSRPSLAMVPFDEATGTIEGFTEAAKDLDSREAVQRALRDFAEGEGTLAIPREEQPKARRAAEAALRQAQGNPNPDTELVNDLYDMFQDVGYDDLADQLVDSFPQILSGEDIATDTATESDVATETTVDEGDPFTEVKPVVSSQVAEYAASRGIEYDADVEIEANLTDETRNAIREAWEAAEHRPTDPEVRAAYDAFMAETVDQFNYIRDEMGIDMVLWDGDSNEFPYATARDVARDIVENGRMYVFPTSEGFGSDTSFDSSGHPMLEDSPIEGWKFNDVFRAVHDVMGHMAQANEFNTVGEDNAWREHYRLYSDTARPAMFSETLAQSSTVFTNPTNAANIPLLEEAYDLLSQGQLEEGTALLEQALNGVGVGAQGPGAITYADQKATILPQEIIDLALSHSQAEEQVEEQVEDVPDYSKKGGRKTPTGNPVVYGWTNQQLTNNTIDQRYTKEIDGIQWSVDKLEQDDGSVDWLVTEDGNPIPHLEPFSRKTDAVDWVSDEVAILREEAQEETTSVLRMEDGRPDWGTVLGNQNEQQWTGDDTFIGYTTDQDSGDTVYFDGTADYDNVVEMTEQEYYEAQERLQKERQKNLEKGAPMDSRGVPLVNRQDRPGTTQEQAAVLQRLHDAGQERKSAQDFVTNALDRYKGNSKNAARVARDIEEGFIPDEMPVTGGKALRRLAETVQNYRQAAEEYLRAEHDYLLSATEYDWDITDEGRGFKSFRTDPEFYLVNEIHNNGKTDQNARESRKKIEKESRAAARIEAAQIKDPDALKKALADDLESIDGLTADELADLAADIEDVQNYRDMDLDMDDPHLDLDDWRSYSISTPFAKTREARKGKLREWWEKAKNGDGPIGMTNFARRWVASSTFRQVKILAEKYPELQYVAEAIYGSPEIDNQDRSMTEAEQFSRTEYFLPVAEIQDDIKVEWRKNQKAWKDLGINDFTEVQTRVGMLIRNSNNAQDAADTALIPYAEKMREELQRFGEYLVEAGVLSEGQLLQEPDINGNWYFPRVVDKDYMLQNETRWKRQAFALLSKKIEGARESKGKSFDQRIADKQKKIAAAEKKLKDINALPRAKQSNATGERRAKVKRNLENLKSQLDTILADQAKFAEGLDVTALNKYLDVLFNKLSGGNTADFNQFMFSNASETVRFWLHKFDDAPKSGHAKTRSLWWIDENSDQWKDFYIHEPGKVLSKYYYDLTRQAEYIRRFGEDNGKIEGILKAMGNAYENNPTLDRDLKQVRFLMDGLQAKLHVGHGRIVGARGWRWARQMAGMSAMTATGIVTSINEFGAIPLRHGFWNATKGVATAAPAFAVWKTGNATRAVLGRFGVKVDREFMMPELARLAQEFAIVDSAMMDTMMDERILGSQIAEGNVSGGSTLARRAGDSFDRFMTGAQRKFFKLNMLQPITEFQRIASLVAAQSHIRQNMKRPADQLRKRDIDSLKKANLYEDYANIRTWYNSNRGDLAAMAAQNPEFFRRYETAVHRFVNQTIVHPNRATKPGWGNSFNPFLQVAYQLNSFTNAFREGPAAYAIDRIKNGDTPERLGILLRLLGMMAVSYLVEGPWRDFVQYQILNPDDEKYEEERSKDLLANLGILNDPRSSNEEIKKAQKNVTGEAFNILDKTGATLQWSQFSSVFGADRYGRDPLSAVAGPTTGKVQDVIIGLSRSWESGDPAHFINGAAGIVNPASGFKPLKIKVKTQKAKEKEEKKGGRSRTRSRSRSRTRER